MLTYLRLGGFETQVNVVDNDVLKQAQDYRDSVIPAMQSLRESADELEPIVDADLWPLPTYAEMLFLK